MGLIKKLITGFLILIVLGIVGVFGMNYYYTHAYTQVPVEVKSESVTGDVFYLSHVLDPGKYMIKAGGEGIVDKITILDENGNVITESDTDNLIYSSSNPFQVRIDYKATTSGQYTVKVGIYKLVKK
ncbi:hypothetical protein [Thermococcus sp.]